MMFNHDKPLWASRSFRWGTKRFAVRVFVDALDATLAQRLRCSQLRDVGDGRS